MKQQNPNKTARYLLVLTVLLCVGLLIVSTGVTFARFRAEREKRVLFQVREPEQILLGTVKDEKFTKNDQLIWKTKDGVTTLQFAIANGSSNTDYSQRDQKVYLRMIGAIGIGTGENVPQLTVTFIPQRGDGTEKTIQAKVSPIAEGTALYHTYGQGWLYTFLETTVEGQEELSWKLEGGELSYIDVIITIQGDLPEGQTLLQPLVVAEPMGK